MTDYAFPGLFNYWIVFLLMMIGLYIVIAHENLIKKIVGLNVFHVSVFVFYISMAKVKGGTAPILADNIDVYSNPLPHVLILTAIVVGVATTALGRHWWFAYRKASVPLKMTKFVKIEERAE